MGVVPRPAQVLEVTRGCLQRRHTLHFRRRVGWQDRSAAIHAGVAQPALGAAHQTDRRVGAARARQLANDEALLTCARQRHVGGRQFGFVRQVEERGQQRLAFHAGGRRELRHVQHLLLHLVAIAGRLVHIRQRAMRGAQVDADAVKGLRIRGVVHSSTSA
ncbi:hypothetical protein SDC9_90879 [bioreactor metagenome]|uniref:Uncharacterized protein n=1 Tax=bioreactor metagenome TaxID=1076179 RepID=A0A644ZWA4_9ZZZZ